MTLHFRDRRSAASLEKSPFLCLNRNPFQYGFRALAREHSLHLQNNTFARATRSSSKCYDKFNHQNNTLHGDLIIKLISKTKHLHVPREIPACAMISLITKTTHCLWGLIIKTINFQESFWSPVHRNPLDICVVEIALRKAARGIDSLNNVILFCSIQLKRSKGLKLFDLDESVSEAISSTVRYKLTPDGAVPIEVSKREE